MNSKPNNNFDLVNPLNDSNIFHIGAGFKLVGQVVGDGSCTIDGSFDGSIESAELKINYGAILTGNVKCGQLDLKGRVVGSVETSHAILGENASIEGSISYNTISMASSAIIYGKISCIVNFSPNIQTIIQVASSLKWELPSGEPLPDWIKIEINGFSINPVKLCEYNDKNGQLIISLLAGDEVTMIYFN